MTLCRGIARVISATLLLPGLAALLYYSLPRDPGSLASWLLAYGSSAVAGALVYASARLLHSVFLGLISLLSIAQTAILSEASGYLTLVPVASGIVVLAAVGPRIRGVDSVIELAREPFRPTPVAASLLSSFLLLQYWDPYVDRWGMVVHYSGSLLGGLVYARISRGLWESLVAGLVLGLGPVGVLVVFAPQPFRSLPPLHCKGIAVGRLAGYHVRTSTTRALAMTGQDQGVACSSGPALLSLEEPLVVWLYSSKPLHDALRITSGSRLVLDLVEQGPGVEGAEAEASNAASIAAKGGTGIARLGGVDPVESRFAVAAAVASSGVRADWLVIVGSHVMWPRLLDLVSSARHPRVVVALDGLEGRSVAPPVPGRFSGLIVAPLTDPGDQEHVARSLLGSRVTALRGLLDSGLYLGYPYCGGLVMAFIPGGVT